MSVLSVSFPDVGWVQAPEAQGLAAWEHGLDELGGFLPSGPGCKGSSR